MNINIKKHSTSLLIPMMALISIGISTNAQAVVSCAGTLPERYFERIEATTSPFAGKLVDTDNGTQQLQNKSGQTVISGLSDAYVLMNRFVVTKKDDKYGVVNAAGEVIVPFAYDDIQSEPDIATNFIVSTGTDNDAATKQGIINRDGDWVYPLSQVQIRHAHYDPDYDQDFFIVTQDGLSGLLDDRGYWAIMPRYEALQPLNACTGMPLYIRATRQNSHALLDPQGNTVIDFSPKQHIEWFNVTGDSPLFLRSTLIDDQDIDYRSEDMPENIASAQLVDAAGDVVLTSEAPIVKLLYHQLYVYKQDGKFGIIDDQANVVLKPQFDSYEDKGERVWVSKNGERQRLDRLIDMD